MSGVKLSSKLPEEDDENGLMRRRLELVQDPYAHRLVVAVVDVKSILVDQDTGYSVPTVRVRRLELLEGERFVAAERLLREVHELRTGAQMLPLDLDQAVRDRRVDPVTGEVRG